MVTPDDVIAFAPQFASMSPDQIQMYITIASQNVSFSKYVDRYDTAVLLYTCHMLTLSTRAASGGSGPVVSQKVGDVSVQYAQPEATMGQYGLTTYGELFLQLRKALVTTPILV